jgi:hypothetical protein
MSRRSRDCGDPDSRASNRFLSILDRNYLMKIPRAERRLLTVRTANFR